MRHAARRAWMGLAIGLVLLVAGTSRAAEEARHFLDALRDEGYIDMALEYIEQLRTSPLCPEDMKGSLDYEAAITLMSGSLATQDPKLRTKYLDDARDKFEAFLKANPTDALAAGARMQLANVLVERGRFKMEQAAKPGTSAEDKKKLPEEARALFQEAQKVFVELERHFTAEHARFPKVIEPKKVKEIEARDEARKNMLNARLALAQVIYEVAGTYPRDSKEYKEQMTGAAKAFNELYTRYKTFAAGIYARMWEGRCFKEMGDAASQKSAQLIFEEMAVQPDEPKAFRDMKNKSLIMWLEMLSSPSMKKHADALKKAQEWEESARPNEESSPDGLTIRFLEAEAAYTLLKGMKKEDKSYRDMFKEAIRNYEFVARFEGKRQLEARTKARELRGGEKLVAKNFAEARDYGKAALDEMQSADLEMRLAADQGKLDAAKKAEFDQRIATAKEEAKTYFAQALELAAREPRSDELVADLNTVRYYLTFLYYSTGDLFDAAVIGEFLARKYPNSAGARPGAKIALAAWVKLRADLPKDADRSFETAKLTGLAEFIAGRWPGGPEAEDATVMLVRSAVADQDVKKAQEYLVKLPADSVKRAEAEVLVGQALWSAYLRAGRLSDDQRPKQDDLDAMVKQAQELLEKGVARLTKEVEAQGVDYTLASAVLSLSQIYVDTGEAKKALEKLNDPKTGPVTLTAANDPATDRGNFRSESYKAALRAYVADQQLDKAETTMDALEKLIGSDPDAANKLTQIYISLGLELQKQLERLRKEKKDKEANAVLVGFNLFLTRIKDRPGNSFNSLHWVAETFYSLGAGLDPGTREPPADAKKYYESAAATYERILTDLGEGKLQAPEGVHVSLMIRRAKCLRRLGQHKEAMNLLVEVINEKPMMVDAQIEAAYTYQSWATEQGKEGYYVFAIQGGKENKKTGVRMVWGWGKLARLVFPSPPHREIFHEARYNLALCRFEYAQTRPSSERAETLKILKQAEQNVLDIQNLFPDMGGDAWFDKYNELVKRIRRAMGRPAEGLPRPKPGTPATPAAAGGAKPAATAQK